MFSVCTVLTHCVTYSDVFFCFCGHKHTQMVFVVMTGMCLILPLTHDSEYSQRQEPQHHPACLEPERKTFSFWKVLSFLVCVFSLMLLNVQIQAQRRTDQYWVKAWSPGTPKQAPSPDLASGWGLHRVPGYLQKGLYIQKSVYRLISDFELHLVWPLTQDHLPWQNCSWNLTSHHNKVSPDTYRVSVKRNHLRCIRHLIRMPNASCIGVLDEAFWACPTDRRPWETRAGWEDYVWWLAWKPNGRSAGRGSWESEVWACMVSTTLWPRPG